MALVAISAISAPVAASSDPWVDRANTLVAEWLDVPAVEVEMDLERTTFTPDPSSGYPTEPVEMLAWGLNVPPDGGSYS